MQRGRMIPAAVAAAVLVAAGVAGGAFLSFDEGDPGALVGGDAIFHVTLAAPEKYQRGIHTNSFVVPDDGGGRYVFGFVPSGSSPKTLSITLSGGVEYSEDFVLEGTRHETGLGEYYTWEYMGDGTVAIPGGAAVAVEIDPNGNTQGSVSVYLFED